MTHIKESLHVRCPREPAREYICKMLLSDSGNNSPLPLRLAVKIPWTGFELAKDVTVEYVVAAGPAHVNDPIGVRWTPLPGGLYPSFEGEINVLSGNHSYSSVLELTGHYTPPLGIFGAGFDAAVGHKVAEATARYLLEGLAEGILSLNRTSNWQQAYAEINEYAETPSYIRVVSATCTVVHAALPSPKSE